MANVKQIDWKSPVLDGRCPTAIDWAMLAAYIDGEGSILINSQRHKNVLMYVRVTVANTDVRLMAWLVEKFGGTYRDANTLKYYEGKNWKRAYHWGLGSARACWLLHNCMPYFVIKAEQAQIALQLQETIMPHLRGRELPQSVHEKRKSLKARLLVLKAKGINGIPVPSGPISKAS